MQHKKSPQHSKKQGVAATTTGGKSNLPAGEYMYIDESSVATAQKTLVPLARTIALGRYENQEQSFPSRLEKVHFNKDNWL